MHRAIPSLPQYIYTVWYLVKYRENVNFLWDTLGMLQVKDFPVLNQVPHHEDVSIALLSTLKLPWLKSRYGFWINTRSFKQKS
jgi:hypothetical protein